MTKRYLVAKKQMQRERGRRIKNSRTARAIRALVSKNQFQKHSHRVVSKTKKKKQNQEKNTTTTKKNTPPQKQASNQLTKQQSHEYGKGICGLEEVVTEVGDLCGSQFERTLW